MISARILLWLIPSWPMPALLSSYRMCALRSRCSLVVRVTHENPPTPRTGSPPYVLVRNAAKCIRKLKSSYFQELELLSVCAYNTTAVRVATNITGCSFLCWIDTASSHKQRLPGACEGNILIQVFPPRRAWASGARTNRTQHIDMWYNYCKYHQVLYQAPRYDIHVCMRVAVVVVRAYTTTVVQ